MNEAHPEDNFECSQTCHYCKRMFKTKNELMAHSTRAYPERVMPCDYGDSECWFSHHVIPSKDCKCNIVTKFLYSNLI